MPAAGGTCRPFLKWPGGKARQVPLIREALGAGERLIEPFTGSAALFLNSHYPRYLLADSNPDLITLYTVLQEQGMEFIRYARELFQPANNTPEAYYELRRQFNETTDRRRKAALFVYLNRHCYNGLCRYSRKSGFNVPFGRYRNPGFPERAMVAFLKRSGKARFLCGDYLETMDQARRGDVVYCDPPYVPLSETASFTSYAAGGFGWEDQRRLAEKAGELARRGVRVVISNHATPEIEALYGDARLVRHREHRSISRNVSSRGPVAELLAIFEPGTSR
ncbi:MAG: Dam family site-specific DNA-(adenine-N6)-methyltransferase [Gammaproteobacteria bacterium]|nr:MAG: Dam family site-specific DNA-(adenine-N6)-methyltransferase [Gammaproteobacteria bacterium]